jgi:hypothetical protein
MSKRIGSTFSAELFSAGLGGLPFSWSDDGELFFSDEITDEQRHGIEMVLAAHDPAAADAADSVKQQIAALEADSSKPRRQREAILGIDNGWLADVNAQIVALRAKLK